MAGKLKKELYFQIQEGNKLVGEGQVRYRGIEIILK